MAVVVVRVCVRVRVGGGAGEGEEASFKKNFKKTATSFDNADKCVCDMACIYRSRNGPKKIGKFPTGWGWEGWGVGARGANRHEQYNRCILRLHSRCQNIPRLKRGQ